MKIDRRERENGFTLIEVLITVTLMGVIGGAIGTAMSGGLRATKAVAQDIPGPQASQSLMAWLSADFESAIPSTVDPVPLPVLPIDCTSAPETGTRNVVQFEATNPADTSVRYSVYYRYHETNKTLWRTFCKKGTNPSVHGEIVENVSASPYPIAILSPDKKKLTLELTVLVKQRAYPFSLTASVRTPNAPPTTGTLPPGPGVKLACQVISGSTALPNFVREAASPNPLTGSVQFTVNTNFNTGIGSTCDDIWIRVVCTSGECGDAGNVYLQLSRLAAPNNHKWQRTIGCVGSAQPPSLDGVHDFCLGWKTPPGSAAGWKKKTYAIEVVDGYDPVDLAVPAPLAGPVFNVTVNP